MLGSALLLACGEDGTDATRSTSETRDPASDAAGSTAEAKGIRFVDVTEAAGIDFVHFNDASDDRLLPETMGSGAAFLDYDRDGRPDLYLVNGAPLGRRNEFGSAAAPTGALYHNLGEGRFEDVTSGSGLDLSFYGMGATVGDIDDDGWIDLVVTALGRDHVFRNRGDGTFEDVAVAMGLPSTGFTTSAAFVDYDRDGFLDLFLCRYVEWSPESDLECRPDGVHRIYCTPESYPAVSNLLLRNEGGRRFVDVSTSSGIGAVKGKALGVVPLDHDGDGWPDLVVANDTVRNFLFRNRADGTFEEIGAGVGIAFSESGAPRGGMGVDAGDLDGDGRADIVVTNFTHEMVALFRATGTGSYLDDAAHLGLGFPTLLTLGFGVLVEDLDGDGFADVVIANGHIEPAIADLQRGQTHAQRPQIFFGDGSGRLAPLEGAGAIGTALVGRGLAAADVDGDGDLDLLFTQNGGAARLYRNDSPPHHWIRLVLEGGAERAGGAVRPSNRSGYGARLTLHAGGRAEVRDYVSGRSYLSAHDPGVTFGLGPGTRVDSLVVDWPSGAHQSVVSPEIDRVVRLREP